MNEKESHWLLWAVLPVAAGTVEARRLGRRRFLIGITYNLLHVAVWGLLTWALVRSVLAGESGQVAAFTLLLIALGLSGLVVRWIVHTSRRTNR
jgi:hypothetical protein